MHKIASVFPVLPGKDASSIAEMLRGRPDEHRQSRERLGVVVERAYSQDTPMGTLLISYLEGTRSLPEAMAQLPQSDLPIDRDFTAAVAEVHGIDLTQPPPGPPPELLGDWADPAVKEHRRGLAFAAPVRPGATDAGRAFTTEAYAARQEELAASRREKGVSRELVALNSGPMGDLIAVYFEADDPVAANAEFARSGSDYDAWFKGRLVDIFPPEIDLSQPLPPIREVFDWVGG